MIVPISGRRSEIRDRFSYIEHLQFTFGYGGKGSKATGRATFEQGEGFFTAKRPYHG